MSPSIIAPSYGSFTSSFLALGFGFFFQVINEPQTFGDILSPINKISHQNKVPLAKNPVVLFVYYFLGSQKTPKSFKIAFDIGDGNEFIRFGVFCIFIFQLGLQLGAEIPFRMLGKVTFYFEVFPMFGIQGVNLSNRNALSPSPCVSTTTRQPFFSATRLHKYKAGSLSFGSKENKRQQERE